MKKPTRQEIKTAYHEAGHAVARVRLGLSIKKVTIVEKDDSYGHVAFQYPKWLKPDRMELTPSRRIKIENEIIAGLAGHATELIYSGRNNWSGSSSDRDRLIDLALYITGSEAQLNAYLNWLQIRTIDFLQAPFNWLAVENVAQELIKKGSLTAQEVKIISRKKLVNTNE